jgi:FkbM family methyltransferase
MIFGFRQKYYAEDKTDKFLRKTFFKHVERGVMVEVGAAGPTYLSMSRHFRESGWRVVAIEPNPYFIAQHEKEGFTVLPFACGERDEDNVDFEVVHQPAAYGGGTVSYESFSSLGIPDSYRKANPGITSRIIKVNVRRLDSLLTQEAVDRVDLLSIDVEGWEVQVLNGFSLEKFKPVVVMENFVRDPNYATYMERRGYRLYADRFPNQIYVVSS